MTTMIPIKIRFYGSFFRRLKACWSILRTGSVKVEFEMPTFDGLMDTGMNSKLPMPKDIN